jgi:hypothetical protein
VPDVYLYGSAANPKDVILRDPTSVTVNISGVASGTSSVSGTLTGSGSLSGLATGTSTVAGTLSASGALVGTGSGTSVVTGSLTGNGLLSGTASGISSVAGTLSGSEFLSGSASGSCVVTGTLSGGVAPTDGGGAYPQQRNYWRRGNVEQPKKNEKQKRDDEEFLKLFPRILEEIL